MIKKLFIGFLAVAFLAGCATAPEWTKTKTAQGAAVGTAVGAAGGAIFAPGGSKGTGAIVGAVVGGLAGAGIGYYLDKQAEELAQIPNTTVSQGEDRLQVTMSEGILFDTGSANLKSEATTTLARVAEVLRRYPESKVIIKGFTDDVGSEETNLKLSERRAQMVRNFFIGQNVTPERLTAVGFGESMPVASNETPEGRTKNRRVELEIIPQQA